MSTVMNMPMQIILALKETTLMHWDVGHNAVELGKLPPKHDFLEMIQKMLALWIVMIAYNQTLLALQTRKNIMTLTEVNITKMVYDIAITDNLVPVFDHSLVHVLNVIERANILSSFS
jgi:hypothetical protein